MFSFLKDDDFVKQMIYSKYKEEGCMFQSIAHFVTRISHSDINAASYNLSFWVYCMEWS